MPFEAIDVTELDDPMGYLRELTGGPIATPTVVIDGEARVGFDQEWMEEKLGL